jgi:hypothetical protein
VIVTGLFEDVFGGHCRAFLEIKKGGKALGISSTTPLARNPSGKGLRELKTHLRVLLR